MTTVFLFLLFPEGRPVGEGRRIAGIAGVVAVAVATIGGLLEPHLYGLDHVHNPIPFRLSSGLSDAVIVPGYAVLLAVLVWSVWDLLRRLRRSTGEARLQLRWFVYAALLVVVVFIPSTLVPSAGFWWQVIGALALIALPVSVGIAILKYRLYDIDVVINKTVVYVALAVFITLVYVAVVVVLAHCSAPRTEPRPADRRHRARRRRVPARARARETLREPARLRGARHALRGPRAVQRARRRDLRERGRPAADRPRDRRGDGRRARGGVAPHRRRARAGRSVA